MKPCSRCGYRIEDYLAFCDLCQADIDAERAETPNTVTKVLARDWHDNGLVVVPNHTVLDWLVTALHVPDGCESWSVGKREGVPSAVVLWRREPDSVPLPVLDVPVIFGRSLTDADDFRGKHVVALEVPLNVACLCETVTVVEFADVFAPAAKDVPISFAGFAAMKPRLRTYTVKPYQGE